MMLIVKRTCLQFINDKTYANVSEEAIPENIV